MCIPKITARRSIRKYRGTDVPLDVLLRLIDIARWAPSSKNRQPWEFIVTKDEEKISRIAKIKGEDWIANAPAVILAISDPKKSPIYHMSDTAMAVHNISLAALDYGLGTCWIGIYENREVKKMFNIPEHKVLIGALAVGYPDEKPEKRPRRPIEEIVYIEEYGARIR